MTAHVDDYNNDDDDEIINIVNSVDVNDYDNNNNQSVAPSLRNVGELAGLLKYNYKAIVDDMKPTINQDIYGRKSDEGSDDDDLDSGTIEFDNYSAISIVASKLLHQYQQRKESKSNKKENDNNHDDDQILIRKSISYDDHEHFVLNDGNKMHIAESSSSGSDVVENIKTDIVNNYDHENHHSNSDDKNNITYWDQLLSKHPNILQYDDYDGDNSHNDNIDKIIDADEMIYDYNHSIRYNDHNDNVKVDVFGESKQSNVDIDTTTKNNDDDNNNKKKVRFRGSEMRMILSEELKRQDELILYTVELSEIEKSKALQSAQDIANHNIYHTSMELSKLQQQQDLDLQQIIYKNSLQLSMANSQNIIEKQAIKQQQQLFQLQSQINFQDIHQQYQNLLSDSDKVVNTLQMSEQLLQIDKELYHTEMNEFMKQQQQQHQLLLQQQQQQQQFLLQQQYQQQQQPLTSAVTVTSDLKNIHNLDKVDEKDEDDDEEEDDDYYDDSFDQVTQSIIEESFYSTKSNTKYNKLQEV